MTKGALYKIKYQNLLFFDLLFYNTCTPACRQAGLNLDASLRESRFDLES